jgi:hypothetical protein
MVPRKIPMTGWVLIFIAAPLNAQVPDSVFYLTGILYNASFQPVPATHVINLNTHAGDVSDSLGIFRLPVRSGDTLLVRNIMYMDTLVPVARIEHERYIMLRSAYYPLQEARIFEWGSTYDDFREAIVEMPNQQTLGESMGLPRQDPDYIPYDMNESLLRSTGFLLTSPISYLYHNFSKKAKSNRKVYWLEKNREKHEVFDAIVSQENISEITRLQGEALQEFMAYLFQRLVCDLKCDEMMIYSEIYELWEVYQELQGTEIR